MAYTNAPNNSTYKTVNIEFTAAPNARIGDNTVNRDVRITNMYWDRASNENKERWFGLKKRFGVATTAISLQKVSSADVINGYFYDEDSGYIYWAIKGKVYNMNLSTNTVTLVQTMTNTSSLYVGFCAFLTSAGTRYICFTDGLELYYSTAGSGTATEVTDADLPVPHQPFPVFLDGYLFLIKTNTGDIYNSDLDAPQTWTAGSFISTEITPDYVLRIAKLKNYLIAFGSNDIEYFYDAGISSGSPMARNESYNHKIGYIGGLQQVGDRIIFVGREENDRAKVFITDGDKITAISNSVIERNLHNTSVVVSEFTTQKNVANIVSQDGHTFYVLNTADTVWAFDVETGFWYQWAGTGGNNNTVTYEATFNTKSNGTYVATASQTVMGLLGQSTYQDYGNNFDAIYQTEEMRFGTMNWKSCSRLMLITDMPIDGGSTTNVSCTWSDNDWNSSYTARNINIASSNPYITQLGRFRARAYRFTYSDNYPVRYYGLEMDLNVGAI